MIVAAACYMTRQYHPGGIYNNREMKVSEYFPTAFSTAETQIHLQTA
jgi:hypothetical protein